ncbi:MAG: hypothetical protein HGA77_08805 [Chlorobiaceae bacterium]|nr:hypothetical protein [Chlorobiaceae bacterium]
MEAVGTKIENAALSAIRISGDREDEKNPEIELYNSENNLYLNVERCTPPYAFIHPCIEAEINEKVIAPFDCNGSGDVVFRLRRNSRACG